MSQLKKGETVTSYSQHSVLIGKCRDKRDVVYLSTEFKNISVWCFLKTEMVKKCWNSKPEPTLNFNNFMSGIDWQDQMNS